MSESKVGGLPAKWRKEAEEIHIDGSPVLEVRSEMLLYHADELEAALSAHGKPVDYSPALHSVLSYIAYGECDEEGLHPGLFATVKEKIDKLRSKPVVDEDVAEEGGFFHLDDLARAIEKLGWRTSDFEALTAALGDTP